MFAQERQQAILDALQSRSPLTVPALGGMLKASPATVRRDLAFLEGLGRIVRTHGGVMNPEQADAELSFDRKSRAAMRTKSLLAEAALAWVKRGQVVFVDAGSTTLPLGRALLSRENLTIVTNSVPLLSERPREGTRLISLGGEVRGVSLAMVGAGAMEWLRRIHIDVAFLGASGMNVQGVTTTELSEAEVKSAVLAGADRTAVLADGSKWNRSAPIRFSEWRGIQHLFTDRELERKDRMRITTQGTRIHIVRR